MIQIHKTLQNTWHKSEIELPNAASHVKAQLVSKQEAMVFNLWHMQLKATYMLSESSLHEHGKMFNGQQGAYCVVNPLLHNEKMYSYNYENRIFAYDFNNAQWEKLKL